jgi:HSF-type DNA-binding
MHIEKAPGSAAELPPVQWGTSPQGSKRDIIIFNDPDRFAASVLPIFGFPKCCFKSFVRKMYRWGFRRTEHGSGTEPCSNSAKAFCCDNFRRGDFRSVLQMTTKDCRPKKPGKSKMKNILPPRSLAEKNASDCDGTNQRLANGDVANLLGRTRVGDIDRTTWQETLHGAAQTGTAFVETELPNQASPTRGSSSGTGDGWILKPTWPIVMDSVPRTWPAAPLETGLSNELQAGSPSGQPWLQHPIPRQYQTRPDCFTLSLPETTTTTNGTWSNSPETPSQSDSLAQAESINSMLIDSLTSRTVGSLTGTTQTPTLDDRTTAGLSPRQLIALFYAQR